MTYDNRVLDLRGDDLLIVYTDGLPEALNFRDQAFGRQRARAAAADTWGRGETAEGAGRFLLWELRRFAGLRTRQDDLTLVTIKVQ